MESAMNRFVLAVLMLFGSLNAWSLGHLANIEILDRDSGVTLPVYRFRGENWVAGNPGARYAVVINNLRGERLLAVASVDGVNVVSGETAAWDQTGYVLEGGQRCAIDGWRKSNREVADFNFTALPDSYAALTGRAGNVGIIGVAIFREHPQARDRQAEIASQRNAPAVPPGRASAGAWRDAPSAAAPRLGTGHGEREISYVSNTQFDRLSESPDEIVRVRYDRFDNLVAMGVVRSRGVPARPDAFPDSSGRFVPDPPGQ